MNALFVVRGIVPALVLFMGLSGPHGPAQGSGNPQSNTATTRTNNPDGSVTVTTTTTYKDGSTTTSTNYDKDGHDAGTTRTDVQTKDGETTTTTTKYDGSGHETGRTIERVDKDGNKTTTTYDSQGHETGKTTTPKGAAPGVVQSSLHGMVVPDNVHDQQPFSFAVTENPGQGQIKIQTLSGVVVDQRPPDKYGRVFLSAGLAAGSYLISRTTDGSNKTDEVGKLEIKPRPNDASERIWDHPPQQVRIDYPPQSVKVGDPLWLSGHGFNPNCANMEANLLASNQTHVVPVLAATEEQLKLAPITEMKPGAGELKITNAATHQSAPSLTLVFYDLQGHLQRNKLRSGEETKVAFEALPANLKMNLHASISGKATFSGGRTQMDALIEHGQLTVPVDAKKGAGDFEIDFEGQPELPQRLSCGCGCGGTAQPGCAHKGCSCSKASLENASIPQAENATKTACSCGCGGTAQPACAHKNCACSKTMAAAANSKTSCTCGCGGTAQPACAHKNCVCAKSASLPVAMDNLQPRLENFSKPKPTGKGGCSCGCGGTAQPRCAHKSCGCSSSVSL